MDPLNFLTYFVIYLVTIRNNKAEEKVQLQQGDIIGIALQTLFNDKKYFAFYGIPYAKPPIGELRFKPPEPALPFNGTFNATKRYIGLCAQSHLILNDKHVGVDDCLYLNVYTPIEPKDEVGRVPVMVWIHGRSFFSSVPHSHGPEFLLEQDVIVVTVNYRIGALGFLNINNHSALGNMGIKDIIMALTWIQKNIASFGGDREKVTVFGTNSGGTIVSLLLLSSLAEGLFSRAIIQSGSVFTPGLFQNNPIHSAEKLSARIYRKPNKTMVNIKALEKAETKDIVASSSRLYDSTEVRDNQRPIIAFGPSIERIKIGAFLYERPEDIYRKGKIHSSKVPVLIGYNSQESISELYNLVSDPNLLHVVKHNFQYLVPFDGKRHKFESKEYNDIANEIRNFFFHNGTIKPESLEDYLTYASDLTVYPIYRNIREHLRVSEAKIYAYRFSYEGGYNVFRSTALPDFRTLRGASNGDEICYLFKCRPYEERYEQLKNGSGLEADRIFIRRLTRLWTNFAKSGNPTPSRDTSLDGILWEPLSDIAMRVMDLGKDMKMVIDPEQIRIKFWDDIYYRRYKEVKDEL